MVYYMERIQIKINWGRRCIRQNKEVANGEELLISSPCGVMNTLLWASVCNDTRFIAYQGSSKSLACIIFLEVHHILPVWLTFSLLHFPEAGLILVVSNTYQSQKSHFPKSP